jgi:AcrR family transcriptional regulator
MALAAAWKIAEAEGLRGLGARKVAREIGYTVGTLYNVFTDLDDLIVQLIGRIFDALYDELKNLQLDEGPEAGLRELAAGYIRFTARHPRLWGLLFEHQLPEGKEPPEENEAKIHLLLGLMERAVASEFPPGKEAERLHVVRVLWASLHGMCSLASAGKLAPEETLDGMTETLISCFLVGLPTPPAGSCAPCTRSVRGAPFQMQLSDTA